MVNFSDTSTTYASADFSSLLFGTGNNSMRDYYQEVSYGVFCVSAGPAGVTGWYNAVNSHDYYGTDEGVPGSDAHPAALVIEAVAAADASVNFSAYDQDGDCLVDVVAIVHQGTGQEAGGPATDIWSHRWDLFSANFFGDGSGVYTTNDLAACGPIQINDYIIQPEILYGQIQTIGVFAHEYGHALGLPDLYDTDGSSEGIGSWGLMASGSWNRVDRSGDSPAHLSAWSKYQLGWVSPAMVNTTLTNEPIAAASGQADVYQLLSGSPSTGGEYFLIENRQQSGFDAGLPGAGIAIWHIDEAKTDNRNECTTATGCTNHYKVALEQADGLFELEKNVDRGDTGDLYVSGKEFTPTTVPNSLTYSGTDNQINITDISAVSSVMTATIGLSAIPLPDCIINDPGFETGTPNSYWTEASTNFGTPLCDASCGVEMQRSGSWWAWFGGIRAVEDGSLEQTVTIPANAESLTFYVWVPYQIYADDYLRVSLDGTPLWEVSISNNSYSSGYSQITLDISAYADDLPHILRLSSHIGNNPTPSSFMVDDLCLTTSSEVSTVSTQAVTSIGTTTATGNGTIISLGYLNPTQHGVCWNTTGTPTTGDACTQEGPASATGSFASAMTGLTPNTTYYARAYAAHAMGTFYGEQVSFSTMKGFDLLLYLPAILHGGQ